MKCPNCHNEIDENARFCTWCGAKIEKEASSLDQAVFDAMNAKEELDQNFARDFQRQAQSEPVQQESEEDQWYFVEDNETMGPYSLDNMIAFLNNGRLDESSYVWKDGMDNWKLLSTTELNDYVPLRQKEQNYSGSYGNASPFQQGYEQDQGYQNSWQNTGPRSDARWQQPYDSSQYPQNGYQQSPVQPVYIQNRSIILYILLDLVTCGIFNWYWLYKEAKDINEILRSQGKAPLPSAGVVVVLAIVTCNIYTLYWFYQAGKRVSECSFNGWRPSNDGVLLLIMALFYNVISLAILQNTLNDISRRISTWR